MDLYGILMVLQLSEVLKPGADAILTFPLNVRGGDTVAVEARIKPPGWSGSLAVTFNDGATEKTRVRRGAPAGSIAVPDPPDAGRNRRHPRGAAGDEVVLFVDQVVVTRE